MKGQKIKIKLSPLIPLAGGRLLLLLVSLCATETL